jgi:hypothetical protein
VGSEEQQSSCPHLATASLGQVHDVVGRDPASVDALSMPQQLRANSQWQQDLQAHEGMSGVCWLGVAFVRPNREINNAP